MRAICGGSKAICEISGRFVFDEIFTQTTAYFCPLIITNMKIALALLAGIIFITSCNDDKKITPRILIRLFRPL